MSGGTPCINECLYHRIGVSVEPRRQRTCATAISIRAALPGFLPSEVWEHVLERPVRQSVFGGPTIIIRPVAAHVPHGVRRGRAADNLAASDLDATATHACLRFGKKPPG